MRRFNEIERAGAPKRTHGALSWPGLFAIGIMLSGCTSPELRDTVRQIDQMEREINAPPAPPPPDEAVLDPDRLMTTAKDRGKDFLRARISKARAVVELDAAKSGRYPRVSVTARRISYYTGDVDDITSYSNIVLGVNWDVMRALLRLDRNAVAIAGRLIPVQYQVAEHKAMTRLLSAYVDYSALDFKREDVLNDQAALACKVDDLEVEVALGNASPSELDALRGQIKAADAELEAVKQSMASGRDQLLALAGLAEGGYDVAPGQSMLPALKALPNVVTDDGAACFEHSGNRQLEDLLVAAAGAQLQLAKQSRFTKLTTSVPNFMTQTGGFNLQFLISYVLPLIDQGDSLRLTQKARLSLMETILTARDNRRDFMGDFDSLGLKLAEAESSLATARSALVHAENAVKTEEPLTACNDRVALAKAQKSVRQALFRIDGIKAELRLLCAPIVEG
ncbi:hypothetical protein [Martelella sp. HB161492]|uniref:hypothetical protein n=1 Tax=Martelella sp. HB161492 TaxID=2720726 RepID=UPI001590354F|nr:hypothetical protein [Martelella sp. HB161492]